MKKRLNLLLTTLMAVMMITNPLQGIGTFAAATGNTYYVATTGSDTNNGLSATAPFKTFNKALSTAVAGDTVLAKGGTYSEKIVVSKSGTAGLPITIKNAPGETPVLDGSGLGASGGEGMVNIINKSYVTIDGFEIRNLKSTSNSFVPIGISVYGSGSNIQLLNNRIHSIENPNGNAHGIRVYGTSGTTPISSLVINYNEIFNCKLGQSEALVVNGNVDGFKVNFNKVHDNDNIGIDFIGFEGTAPSNDYARNGECVGNLVYNISSAKNPTYGGDACAGGIYVDGGANILIDRNIVRNADIGIEIATERGPVTKNITVTNNLITDGKPQAGISFGSYAGSAGGGVENMKVFNNTLVNNTYAIQIQKASSSTNLIKNNIFFGGKAITGTVGSNVFANNITADPLFVNAAGGNYSLKAGSPAIDVATEVFGAVDLAGSPRQSGAKVDAGAYEYQGAGSTTTVPTVPTATTTPTTTTTTQTPVTTTQPAPTAPTAPTTSSTTTSKNDVNVILGSQTIDFNTRMGIPFIDAQNRTLVPFRIVLENYGCTVDWNSTEKIAIARKNGVVVKVPIGETYILVNGVKKMNDTYAQIVNDRTYVPIRVVLEAFGAQVSWDGASRTVMVN
jgi:hypothetical protein